MRADEERDYVEYVPGRTLALRRSAFRLCGDWDHAYDLVQITFIQLYQHRRKAIAAKKGQTNHTDLIIRFLVCVTGMLPACTAVTISLKPHARTGDPTGRT